MERRVYIIGIEKGISLGRRECLLPEKDISIMEIYVSISKKFFSILDIVAIIAF